MPGVTKHIYDRHIRDILKMWNDQIKTIEDILPRRFSKDDVISLLKHYYPHEWEFVGFEYEYYQIKDKYIKNHKGKARYDMPRPESLLRQSSEYRKIMSPKWRKQHDESYTADKADEAGNILWAKRELKIRRIDEKIAKAKSYTQKMTPEFADKMIGLYEYKNTSQKDRMYILAELKKYYSPKIIRFFFKLNDTELNRQLRENAFYHLQAFNYQPRLRRQKYMQAHTSNKKRKEYLKKTYPNETYQIPGTPDELEYRINNGKEQQIKTFDYFISHSSRDSSIVQKLIDYENSMQKHIFCDWINDADYLKRHLLCESTLKVLESRMRQSKALIFVDSDNSRASVWCKYELNFFKDLNKPMYTVKAGDVSETNTEIKEFEEMWFEKPDYKEMALLEGKKIPAVS